jgi:hypothetical protein
MMSDIRKLRWINLVGAGSFASYGLLINAWPVVILNGFIVLIDIVHLWQLSRAVTVSRSLEFASDDRYVTTVLTDVWPQLLELGREQRISVEFRGAQPRSFTVLAHQETAYSTRLAA